MPCDKPVVTPIDDECCFSCFDTGREQYQVPIAIVLHEVDEHIEALNNRLENCCNDDPDCHSSFHYGVGHNGRIINWVDPDNTAWSFDPDNSDQNCGTCGWSISVQEGTGVNPNLYTINIAVSTGILAYNQSSHNLLAENNYTEEQYNAIVRLTGWLAETYGIVVNQNNIWRHCDELNDFPEGCSCPPNRFDEFLTDVQMCIDSTALLLPWLESALCDAPVEPGSPTFVLGADAACEVLGRYQLGAVMGGNFCDIMDQVVAPAIIIPEPGVTELVGKDCQAYFMPTFTQLLVATTLPVGAEIVDNTIPVIGADGLQHVIDFTTAINNNLDFCAAMLAAVTTDGGLATDTTQLVGTDCNFYTLPAIQDLCTQIMGIISPFDPTRNLVMLQRDGAGANCNAVVVDPTVTANDFITSAIGFDPTGQPDVGKLRPSMPNRMVTTSTTLAPATDGVLYVDASGGSVTVTLVPPGPTDPTFYHIKRMDTVAANTLTISGGANTIDNSANITLPTPGPLSPNAGASALLYWNGTQWTIH